MILRRSRIFDVPLKCVPTDSLLVARAREGKTDKLNSNYTVEKSGNTWAG